MPTTATLYLGFSRSTPYAVTFHKMEPEIGAALCDCPECGGDGDWTKFYPEPETLTEPMKCVDCKGTGRIWVAI